MRLTIASNLKDARKARGLSQEELANLAGLHRTYVGSVERGEGNISVDSMECLATPLGEPVYSLLMPGYSPEQPS